MNLKHIHISVWLLTLAVSSAQGAGLELNQHGVKELGHGFAGTAALLEDASAIAHNPAGLTRLESSQFSGGVTSLYADIEYDAVLIQSKIEDQYGLDARARDPNAPGKGTSQAITPIPHLYYAHKVNEDTAIGIGVYAPFGSGSDFPKEWQGRYHAEETQQTAVNINPTIATNLSETVSVGLGAVIQMYEATLTNQIDLGYLVAEAVVQERAEVDDEIDDDFLDEVYDVFTPASDPNRYDLDNDIEIDSIAYGFSLGVLWEPTEETRFGLNFRSRTEHIATGEAKRPGIGSLEDELKEKAEAQFLSESQVRELDAAFDKRGAQGGDLTSNVTLPEILEASFYHQLDERWAVLGSIAWTNWSVFEEIRLEYDTDPSGETADSGGTSPDERGGERIGGIDEDLKRRDLVQPLNFDDSWRYALGLEYKATDNLTLRTGGSFDESPLNDENSRTPRGPDNDRIIAGFGASYQVDERLSVDAAYAFTRIKEADTDAIENPAHTLHRLEGTSKANLHSLGVQANYNF